MTKHTIVNIDKLKENLNEVKRKNYSIEDEETEIGAYSIATPIKDYSEQVISAISVTGPKSRIKDKKDDMIDVLINTSIKISKELGCKW